MKNKHTRAHKGKRPSATTNHMRRQTNGLLTQHTGNADTSAKQANTQHTYTDNRQTKQTDRLTKKRTDNHRRSPHTHMNTHTHIHPHTHAHTHAHTHTWLSDSQILDLKIGFAVFCLVDAKSKSDLRASISSFCHGEGGSGPIEVRYIIAK
jgi:hypothetical protein